LVQSPNKTKEIWNLVLKYFGAIFLIIEFASLIDKNAIQSWKMRLNLPDESQIKPNTSGDINIGPYKSSDTYTLKLNKTNRPECTNERFSILLI